MRLVIGLVLLFALAVVSAIALGANDGLVSLYWRGWRLDVSLNLFILGVLALTVGTSGSFRLIRWLLAMPGRARAWREGRRELALQAAQREAFVEYVAGRYSRTVKASRRAQDLLQDLGTRSGQAESRAMHHLLAALAFHRLQDRPARDEEARQAQSCISTLPTSAAAVATSFQEGLTLLRAEWALDDRDAASTLQQLELLSPGAGRRIQAQRLRMQANRLVNEPVEALKAARLLAKHQAFRPEAARGLLRSLAMAVLDQARDADGLRQHWMELDREDRLDAAVVVHAVQCARRLQASAWARRILKPAFEASAALEPDQREELALALWSVVDGIEPDWLALIEPLETRHARQTMVMAAVAAVYAERQLWGKAQPLLEQTARSGAPIEVRRDAWCRLARLALERDDAQTAQDCYRSAAELR